MKRTRCLFHLLFAALLKQTLLTSHKFHSHDVMLSAFIIRCSARSCLWEAEKWNFCCSGKRSYNFSPRCLKKAYCWKKNLHFGWLFWGCGWWRGKAVLWSWPVDPWSDPGWCPDGQSKGAWPQHATDGSSICKAVPSKEACPDSLQSEVQTSCLGQRRRNRWDCGTEKTSWISVRFPRSDSSRRFYGDWHSNQEMKPMFLNAYRHVHEYVTEPTVSLLLLFGSKIISVLIILKRVELYCWTDSAMRGSKLFDNKSF